MPGERWVSALPPCNNCKKPEISSQIQSQLLRVKKKQNGYSSPGQGQAVTRHRDLCTRSSPSRCPPPTHCFVSVPSPATSRPKADSHLSFCSPSANPTSLISSSVSEKLEWSPFSSLTSSPIDHKDLLLLQPFFPSSSQYSVLLHSRHNL